MGLSTDPAKRAKQLAALDKGRVTQARQLLEKAERGELPERKPEPLPEPEPAAPASPVSRETPGPQVIDFDDPPAPPPERKPSNGKTKKPASDGSDAEPGEPAEPGPPAKRRGFLAGIREGLAGG